MRTDTADRLPFIGKSFLIPQMSADPGALTAELPAIVAGTSATRLGERPSGFDLELSTNRDAEERRTLAIVFRDVFGSIILFFAYFANRSLEASYSLDSRLTGSTVKS